MKKLRFGLWYDFRNPPRWRQDPTGLYQGILAQIARAERLGFDDVWLSEHHFVDDDYTPSVLALAAAIAARTRTMRIGTSVLLLPLHDPIRVAEDAATVDVLSGGRLDLGVGLGYRVEEFAGFEVSLASRRGRLEEALPLLRRLFSGETVTHRGRYYRCENAALHPLPIQKPFRILLGGFVEAAARRAAHYADGLIVSGGDRAPIDAYRHELARIGKQPEEHEVVGGVMWLIVARDPERRWREAREHFRYQIDLYGRWSAEVPGRVPGTPLFLPDTSTDDALRAAGARIVTPEQAIAEIQRFQRDTNIDRWYTWTLPPGLSPEWADEHIELMATQVIPAFR